ncbi:MAG: mepA [Firmicutes bacterium]|nr:mepA [Bacillota bacterium]
MDKAKSLGEAPVSSLIWKFSVPVIVGNIVNALYNVVDSIFVGHGVGEIGLAAVTIAFPLMIILMAVGMFVGAGASALVSIRLGEQKLAEAEQILGNALMLIIVLVILSTGTALWFLDPLLIKLGATPDVLPYTHDFMSVILWGSVFLHIGFGLNGIIQAQGDPRTALKTMLISALLNIILNPLFIFGLHLGIKGSALATVIAQAVAASWVLLYFSRGLGTLKLRVKNLVLRWRIILGIAKIGVSIFLMQISNSVVMLLINNSLIVYGGAVAVASFGIINRITMLLLMPVLGITQGAQPIIGYNFGARQYERVVQSLKIALTVATGICIGGFILVQVFAAEVILLFNGGPEMVKVGTDGLRTFLLMLPLISLPTVGGNYFQAVGKAGYSIVLNLLRQVILLIPLVLLLPRFFGLQGVWMAAPFSDFTAAAVTGIFLLSELKKLKNKQPDLAQENSGEG